jgi:hypothetical protein
VYVPEIATESRLDPALPTQDRYFFRPAFLQEKQPLAAEAVEKLGDAAG